jgi:hypothetical protein
MNISPFQKLKNHQEVLGSIRAQFSEAQLYLEDGARESTASFLLSLAEVIDDLMETGEGKQLHKNLEILNQHRHKVLFELQVYQRTYMTIQPRRELETRDWLYSELGTLASIIRKAIHELDLIWPCQGAVVRALREPQF